MQIAYNSEIIKAKDDHIREKDKQIELLITSRDKKSYLAFYITLGFIILILCISTLSYYMFIGYKTELVNNQNSKISEITTFNNKIIQYKDERLNETKKELLETKTAYQQTLKAVDLLHVKYNDKLNLKDKQIAEFQNHFLNQIKINSDLKNDTENF